MSQLVLPDNSIKNLAEVIGTIPDSDAVPAAWYMTMDEECIKGYQRYLWDYKAWADRVTELLDLSGIKTDRVRYGGWAGQWLVGFYIDGEPPRWWRRDKKGYIVPRCRTKAERESEVGKRFAACQKIPQAIEYIKGMPDSLHLAGKESGESRAYWPSVRKPGKAVLVFWGADPDAAVVPFEPDARWSRMKMSIYHLLRERQHAAAEVPSE